MLLDLFHDPVFHSCGCARIRDERLTPSYELTCDLATFAPPPPEMLALYEALQDNEIERNRFFGTLAGTVSIPEYYAPENLRRIIDRTSIE